MLLSPSQDQSTGTTKMETLGEAVDDAAITAMAGRTLFCHRSTGTLNGTGSNAEKGLAGKPADDVHGVKKVVNNITSIETP